MPNLAAMLGVGTCIAFVCACVGAWVLAVIRILMQSGEK
jgi:hypothetical protein